MANRKRLFTIKRVIDSDNETISFIAYDLDDKPIPNMHARIECKKISESNRHYGMLFGINQTCGDTMALDSGATLAQKFDAMRERIAHLESGSEDWTSGRGPGEGSILFAALMLEQPERDGVALKKKLDEMTATQKNALMASDRLKDWVAKVRAERGKGVDTDSLFDELDV